MTPILIAADLFGIVIICFLIIVVIVLVGAFSQSSLRPYRRRNRRGFWHDNEPTHPVIGIGLLDQIHETTNHDDLSIYKSSENFGNSTHIGNSGSMLGLKDGTEPLSVNNSGGYGGLGAAAADYLNSDNSGGGHTDFTHSNSGSSNLSDWSSGGSFGDSSSSFSDSGSSFSDSSSSFSDSSGGGSFSSE